MKSQSGCFVCGSKDLLFIHTSSQDHPGLKTWISQLNSCLCDTLEVNHSYEPLFSEASFCVYCQETICQAEFAQKLISKLQLELKGIQVKLKLHFRNTYLPQSPLGLVDDDSSIEAILRQIQTEQSVKTEEEPEESDRITEESSPIEIETQDEEMESQDAMSPPPTPISPTRSSRLMKLKKRQFVTNSEGHWPVGEYGEPSKLLKLSTPVNFDVDTAEAQNSILQMLQRAAPAVTQLLADSRFSSPRFSSIGQVLGDNGVKEEGEGSPRADDLMTHNGPGPDLTGWEGALDGIEGWEGGDEDMNKSSSEANCDNPLESFQTELGFLPGSSKEARKLDQYAKWTKPPPSLVMICNHPDCASKNLSWTRPGLVRAHCLSEHEGEGLEVTPYHCASCPERFPQHDQLQSHLQQSHLETLPVIPKLKPCPDCGKEFMVLLNHLRYCNKSKPNRIVIPSCHLCGKRFQDGTQLQNHSNLHIGRDPFECVLCPPDVALKKFPNKTKLHRHVFIHHFTILPQNSLKTPQKKTKAMRMAALRGIKRLRNFHQGKATTTTGAAVAIMKKCAEPDLICKFTKACRGKGSFPSWTRLRHHLVTDHNLSKEDAESRLYFCVNCKRQFESPADFNVHKRKKRKEDDDWAFSEEDDAIENEGHKSKSTTDEGGFLCAECGRMLATAWRLEEHILEAHQIGPRCTICSKIFETVDASQAHEFLHLPHTPFDCVLCPMKFRISAELRDHVRKTHEPLPWKCTDEGCDKAFGLEAQLQRHVISHKRSRKGRKRTLTEQGIKCPDCDFVTKKSYALRCHRLTRHTLNRPFPCAQENCSKAFISNSRLKAHLFRTHRIGTMGTVYPCRLCGKEMRTRDALSRHEECHGTERPFVCEICSAAFKVKKHLQQHSKVHDPEKKTGNNWKLQQPRKPRLKPTGIVEQPPQVESFRVGVSQSLPYF